MTDLAAMPERSLEAHPDLVLAGTYTRQVPAPIAAVWENVFDWEHLPWLHAGAFRSIELRASGRWGWHADLAFAAGPEAEIELVVDPARSCYVARTRSGAGAPGEIWTHLESRSEGETGVRVAFRVPPVDDSALRVLGDGYRTLYQQLWDEDESMILERRAAIRAQKASRSQSGSGAELDLGPLDALRGRLPLVVDFAGHRFRVVESGGRLYAHAAECPHWLGPLDACDVSTEELVCPWHGYRFDLKTGRSLDGRTFRLRRPPRVQVDHATSRVHLLAAD
jgi:nitrite reductase/ring-hydroxylating ferredoxin subunit/uncharacterized protein YndB with AHSA1/START domain